MQTPQPRPGFSAVHAPRSRTLRVLVVAGARPNFVKVAPIVAALRARGHGAVLVHTGQHYDAALSGNLFADLDLPAPDHHLGAGSGTHAVQTARVMEAFEPVLLAERPDWVVVVGDVNSTLACALVAAKLKEAVGCRVAHVEAGLRSGDWRMPEEVNRVLTDRLADLLLTPSADAAENLAGEGIDARRVRFVGNVMVDTLFSRLDAARAADAPSRLGLADAPYAAATLHRPSNVDHPGALSAAMSALAAVAGELPVVLPLHPRTRARLTECGAWPPPAGVLATEPLGYLDMVSLMDGAAVVVTDSGGVQEETTALGVPCVTLRERTERPVTVRQGTNRLAPFPLTPGGVLATVRAARAMGRVAPGMRCPPGWDGRAALRVVAALERCARLPLFPIAPATDAAAAV